MNFWEEQLGDIREELLLMSSLTEQSLGTALRALLERDDALASEAEAADAAIDHLEVRIDEMVVTFMATHGPVAKDCRFMLAASKIASNLERIADEATKIARRARDLNREPLLEPLIDIPLMGGIGGEMLHDGITAFVEGKPELAIEIVARDQSVNDLYKQLARALTSYMIEDPKTITRALHLLTIAKALERVADHATNIAEEVFYLCKGQDIRHERSRVMPAGAS